IPADPPVTQPGRKIDRFHAILPAPPAKRRAFRRVFLFRGLQPFFKAPIGGEHRHLMAAPRQSFETSAHLNRRATEFEEWRVSFRDVQDSHWSRRIFLSDFEKTLKRNSCSTRAFPRVPISLACTGSVRMACRAVASWMGSPWGTR